MLQLQGSLPLPLFQGIVQIDPDKMKYDNFITNGNSSERPGR